MSNKMSKYVINNSKTAEYFDRKHGTTISQQYDFPFNLDPDDIWETYANCKLRTYLDTIPPHVHESYCDTWYKIVDNLEFKHFPYNGVESLDRETKGNILCGMVSSFNFDDIVYYSIDGIKSRMNIDIDNEIENTMPDVFPDIRWVISPKTLKKMKNQILGSDKLSMTDIVNDL